MKTDPATLKRVYAMSLAGVYPHYVAKAERKGRTKAEVDEIIRWLTGYTQKQLESMLEKRTTLETFISKARMNPSRTLVTGAIWRAEQLEDRGVESAALAWKEVSLIEEELADALAASEPDGRIARRGAVGAADDRPRCRERGSNPHGPKPTGF